MKEPFFIRLRNYYSAVSNVLRGEAEAASIFPNPSDLGDARELVYLNFLRAHLPAACEVQQGGFLFGRDGSESQQLDVIVTTDIAMRFEFAAAKGTSKSFACVDGSVAVASLKSDLTSKELRSAITNIASIPEQSSLEGRHSAMIRVDNYENWPFKIVYAPKGVKGAKALEVAQEMARSVPMHRFPDLIHVAGSFAIMKSPVELGLSDGGIVPPNTLVLKEGRRADVQALLFATTEIQSLANTSRHLFFEYHDLIFNVAGGDADG